MGVGWFVVAAGAAAGCYYGYRKLQQIEMDIREEIRAKGLAADSEEVPPNTDQKPMKSVKVPTEKPAAGGGLEARILAEVKAFPGMLQTDLYKKFPDAERKALQVALLKMDKGGELKRSKENSTYKLDLP